MTKDYWVIKITDNDGEGYVFRDNNTWHYSSCRYDTTKFSSLEECRKELKAFKESDSRGWEFDISGHFPKVRPVKVKVKKYQKKPDNLPKVNSLYSNGEMNYFVVYTGRDEQGWWVRQLEYPVANLRNKVDRNNPCHLYTIYFERWLQMIEQYKMKLVGAI